MSERLLVGSRKGLFELRAGVHGWRIEKAHFQGQPVTAVLADPRERGLLYCALNLGHFGPKLWRSSNDGGSWQECACPAYPPQPPGEAEKDLAWTLAQIWTLEAGGEPGTLWAGTNPGGLFRSGDGGDSWGLVESLWNRPERREWMGGGNDTPGIHSVLVDPRDSRRVTLGVSVGGVWQTSDAGESWKLSAAGMRALYMPPEQQGGENVQDPHRLAQCAAAPDVVWAQHHCGIFRSTDAGRTWTMLEGARPSSFGFAVAAHPRDPEVAWFVPLQADEQRVPVEGKLVVTRTRDGGKSFEALRAGLPQEHAYDLVYRHGLDVDASGERLAIGSTTGGLWISMNGGDSWQCVSAHLPPIYCLRFAS